jgi:hypothetical protein
VKIEGVIACVNYGDFLAQTLPMNRHHFDRLVVVTQPEDRLTQKVCEHWHVECVHTDVFRAHWKEFHKGKGINVGLSRLSCEDWLVHMDADIALPPLTREILERAQLDESMIYGIDRFMVANFHAWEKWKCRPVLQHEDHIWVHPNSFPLGVRVCPQMYGGYVPIGFFQLWNGRYGITRYPEHHSTAARTDVQHAVKWPRHKRALIPEIIGYHLESEPAPMGSNWNGRQTKSFDPEGEDACHYGV